MLSFNFCFLGLIATDVSSKCLIGSEGVKLLHHYNLENNIFQVKKGKFNSY